ncbi:MAG: hypothetical protein GVY16_02060 [Planctomycetes bacterium]|jgi:hypothetical protein|nr:hypothetical protein [Phycisphaerae bacterium]NBB94506.1 hypothetical protein [Planctomycetota bacterium]
MRYLAIAVCVTLLSLPLLGCKGRNEPPQEPPHEPDATGKPNLTNIVVTDIDGEGRSSSPSSRPISRDTAPTSAPSPAPAAEDAANAADDPATGTAKNAGAGNHQGVDTEDTGLPGK